MRISKEEVALRYERYVTFNAERIKAATEVMDKRTRGIFELVPLFCITTIREFPAIETEMYPLA